MGVYTQPGSKLGEQLFCYDNDSKVELLFPADFRVNGGYDNVTPISEQMEDKAIAAMELYKEPRAIESLMAKLNVADKGRWLVEMPATLEHLSGPHCACLPILCKAMQSILNVSKEVQTQIALLLQERRVFSPIVALHIQPIDKALDAEAYGDLVAILRKWPGFESYFADGNQKEGKPIKLPTVPYAAEIAKGGTKYPIGEIPTMPVFPAEATGIIYTVSQGFTDIFKVARRYADIEVALELSIQAKVILATVPAKKFSATLPGCTNSARLTSMLGYKAATSRLPTIIFWA